MPNVTIRFYTTLRKRAGREEFSCEAATVRRALDAVEKEFGADFMKLVRGCQVFLNGRNTAHQKGGDTPLDGGDTLHIFPPAAGG